MVVSNARVRLLARWLERTSSRAKGARINRAVWSFISASLFGVSVASSIADKQYNDEGSSVLGTGIVAGLSVGLLAQGVLSLALDSAEEARFQRWQAVSVVDAVELARFEGELAASASAARVSRLQGSALWLGAAGGGVALLVLTPFAHLSSSGRTATYITGGAVLALGIWQTLDNLLAESWPEHAYQSYRAGLEPEVAGRRLQIVPVLAAHEGGLSITGTF